MKWILTSKLQSVHSRFLNKGLVPQLAWVELEHYSTDTLLNVYHDY